MMTRENTKESMLLKRCTLLWIKGGKIKQLNKDYLLKTTEKILEASLGYKLPKYLTRIHLKILISLLEQLENFRLIIS